MRIVIVGATGNAGTSLLAALAHEPAVDEIAAIARRSAHIGDARVRMVAADVATADLAPHFAGADVIVHLAWLIQPSRDERVTHAVNVDGTRNVLGAAAHAGVRVVRMRPGLTFKREAATGIRRLFAGPWRVQRRCRSRARPGDARAGPARAAGPLRAGLLRGAAALTWTLRLQPSPPGWIDLAFAVPPTPMDTARARTELGWQPRRTSVQALNELLDGLRDGADFPTPPLSARTTAPLRERELRTGVGAAA